MLQFNNIDGWYYLFAFIKILNNFPVTFLFL